MGYSHILIFGSLLRFYKGRLRMSGRFVTECCPWNYRPILSSANICTCVFLYPFIFRLVFRAGILFGSMPIRGITGFGACKKLPHIHSIECYFRNNSLDIFRHSNSFCGNAHKLSYMPVRPLCRFLPIGRAIRYNDIRRSTAYSIHVYRKALLPVPLPLWSYT